MEHPWAKIQGPTLKNQQLISTPETVWLFTGKDIFRGVKDQLSEASIVSQFTFERKTIQSLKFGTWSYAFNQILRGRSERTFHKEFSSVYNEIQMIKGPIN